MGRMAHLAVLWLCVYGVAWGGQPPTPASIADREVHRQQEQDRKRLQDLRDARPDVRLQVKPLVSVPQAVPSGETGGGALDGECGGYRDDSVHEGVELMPLIEEHRFVDESGLPVIPSDSRP